MGRAMKAVLSALGLALPVMSMLLVLSTASPMPRPPFTSGAEMEAINILKKHCDTFVIDGGSNIGDTLIRVFEDRIPTNLHNAWQLPVRKRDDVINKWGKKLLETPGRGVCAVGFEANPVFFDRLRNVTGGLTQLGFPSVVFQGVLGRKNSRNVPFYTIPDPVHNHWGSSTSKFKASRDERAQVVNARMFSLSSVMRLLGGRSNKARFAIKLDIECAEYEVIRDLMLHGLEGVVAFAIEFHPPSRCGPDYPKPNAFRSMLTSLKAAAFPSWDVVEI